jgi:hypothetical protein
MTRPLPAAPLLALLKTFDPNNPDPPAAMRAGADGLLTAVGQAAIDDLNDGQYAALIDRVITMGETAFATTRLAMLVVNGNLTLPVYEFQQYGDRGLSELDVWLAGAFNS